MRGLLSSRSELLYSLVFRRVLHPAWESWWRGRPTLDYWRRLEELQWASRDELEAFQLGELRALLRHAWMHVPFYRQRMEEAGLAPDRVRSLDDLRALPILTREEAAAHADARRSTAPPLPAIQKATSGSTGRPLAFGYDHNSEYWRQAIKLRGYGWVGYLPGCLSLHYWGAPAKRPPPAQRAKISVDRALRREIYADCGRRGDAELRAVADIIRQRKPDVLVCYSQAGADLARFINENDLRSLETTPVICGAERLFPGDRAALEHAFGPAVFETYGAREVMLIAMESPARDGLLVQMENLIVEVIVRDSSGQERPARPGETGEVVLTDLHNFGMPFIRYANGDLAVAGDEGKSACGRAHQRLASIEGRVTETLTDHNGARMNGLVFNVMFASFGDSVRQFQAVQRADKSIILRVVPSENFDDATQRVVYDVAARYMPGVPFELHTVSEIPPLPGGKRQVVVVEQA
jgi:phenylacetate-CoA ligase